jgi:triacylglycerol lipase
MTLIPEQSSKSEGLDRQGAEASPYLRLDPPIGSSDWILVRGHVVLPQRERRRIWWPRRRMTQAMAELTAMNLEVRLPDDEPRPLVIASDGSFEARLAVSLPRLRAAQRQLVFSLRYRNVRVEQPSPLFMPQPNAALGVIVLKPVVAQTNAKSLGSLHVETALSEVSRELVNLLTEHTNRSNPIFYLTPVDGAGMVSTAARVPGWPHGLTIALAGHGAISAIAMEQANWIARLTELFAGELEFVVVADTDPHSVATLRTLVRQNKPLRGLRAVFLSDTRPVARGVMLQADRPTGIDDLELPIVMCGTLHEARRAATVCGLVAAETEPDHSAAHRPARRLTATHARVTRYPLVFCHGMLGYSVIKLRPIDLHNYFNGVRELLTGRGFQVLMPQLGKTHSTEQRAEQLRQTIGRWTSGPVNIVAHSMGGLDARFLISKLDMADRVVSLTTIASPHRGSYFADWFVERFDQRLPFLRGLEHFGLEVNGFRDCTRAACRVFNEVVPDSPKVRYFSYSAFQVSRKMPPVLRRSHSLIARVEGANDGLVSEHSARWGEHIATLRSDHIALVGDRGPEYFDHLAFYTRIVDDLIRHGF